MIFAPNKSLNEELLQLGNVNLFRRASQLKPTIYIKGYKETVIGIGQSKVYEVEKGLRVFDPAQAEEFDAVLKKQLEREHFFAAAIPFDPHSPFEIVIPELAVIISDQGQVSISCRSFSEPAALAILEAIIALRSEPITSTTLSLAQTELETSSQFMSRVSDALKIISSGEMNKIVLSKAMRLIGEKLPDAGEVLARFTQDRPETYLFSIADFVGASPELVVHKASNRFLSRPLAGTAASSDVGTLMTSHKDNEEHSIVLHQILNRLAEIRVSASAQLHPTIASYREIVHLGSWITGSQNSTPPFTGLELAARISPTAAINGDPFDSALDYILSFEPLARGFYGGLVGYQKQTGDGSWILNIRSVHLASDRMTVQAGVGVVDRSTPEGENSEATAKINSILSSLIDI